MKIELKTIRSGHVKSRERKGIRIEKGDFFSRRDERKFIEGVGRG